MVDMFWQCESLQNIDLSNIHYKNVERINYIFYGCPNLKEIKFNSMNWNCIEGDMDLGFEDEQKQNIKIIVDNVPKEYNEFMTNLVRVRLTTNNLLNM